MTSATSGPQGRLFRGPRRPIRAPRRASRPSVEQALEDRLLLSTFTVTNTLDDGSVGSLRWAINQVDADTGTGLDTIGFKIPGAGPFTIAPTSPLPNVTHAALIDGYSQPGSSKNTLAVGDNAAILVDLDGTNAGYFVDGLAIAAGGSTVQGLAIGGFGYGIHLTGPGRDVVAGDFIGTDVAGQVSAGNAEGVLVDMTDGNTIGGTSPAARNVISSNSRENVDLFNGSTGNLVEGNYIGLSASGASVVSSPGYSNGIDVSDAPGNTIGGTSAAARNVVAGQPASGIVDFGSGRTLIEGNDVGTDATGTVALPNSSGITIEASQDTVGGTASGAGNLVSGNYRGINLQGGNGLVQGNLVGADVTGTKPLGNMGPGVEIYSSNNTVGGASPGAGNLISGNGVGVQFDYGQGFSGNAILGNLIGTDISGTAPLGNTSDGVQFQGGSPINSIGGTAAGAGNVIAFNRGAGVGLLNSGASSATGAAIFGNSIHDNVGLGIDLGDDGVTPNSPGGPHVGPNNLQNDPTLAAAVTYGGKTIIDGSLNSAPNSIFTIQFYASPVADPSGHGEGQTYLGRVTVTTDGGGNATFLASLPTVVASGQVVSATATDVQGDTSEFSADVAAVASSTPIYAANDSYNVDLNTSLIVAAPGVLANDFAAGGGPLSAKLVAGPAHGSLTLNADGSLSYTPAANFTGVDTFTYRAVQGGLASNVATVTIDVKPKVYVVANTNDSGPGSLRQAILDANLATSPAPDTIQFKIPGTGPFVISPATPLPTLTHATIVDGYTQPGSRANTSARGDNAVILVRIDGTNAGAAADGLVVAGGNSIVRGLSITHFSDGIHLEGSGQDAVTGDFIGVDAAGSTPSGNTNDGVFLDSVASNTIGGASPAARDVISSNSNGVYALSSAADVVQGDYIGTDPTGAQNLGNTGNGLQFVYSPYATVGGAAASAGNVIVGSGFNSNAVDFTGSTSQDSSNALIRGNFIGTDVTGAVALGGGGLVISSTGEMILNNVISSSGDGIDLDAGSNLIQGNRIGVDVSGTKVVGVGGDGIHIYNGDNNTIGGSTPGAGNVISGAAGSGLFILGSSSNVIQGNFIGTDVTGNVALRNGGDGINDYASFNNNTIGGTSRGAGNVISANSGYGILLGSSASGNLIQGNRIGADLAGTKNLGNGMAGIFVTGSNNTIGGPANGANTIAFNGGSGVVLGTNIFGTYPTGVAILSNSIHDNAGIGIDLGNDGVTPNTPGGPHYGANDLQNYPVLISAVSSNGRTVGKGTLNSTPDTTFTIQFFSNPKADPSGYGQGQTYLGQISVTTDANGNASFTVAVNDALPPGQVLSATATDPNGNTSEFSADLTVTGGPSAFATPASRAPAPGPVEDLALFPTGDDALDAIALDVAAISHRRASSVR